MVFQLLPIRTRSQCLLLSAVGVATTSVFLLCRYHHDRYMFSMALVSLALVALSTLPTNFVRSSRTALGYICSFAVPLNVAFLLMKLGSGLQSWDELAYLIQVMIGVCAGCVLVGKFVDKWREETCDSAVETFTWRAVPMS